MANASARCRLGKVSFDFRTDDLPSGGGTDHSAEDQQGREGLAINLAEYNQPGLDPFPFRDNVVSLVNRLLFGLPLADRAGEYSGSARACPGVDAAQSFPGRSSLLSG